MRIPARAKPKGAKVSRVASRSAPVKGWNARDPIASLKPGDAILLENFYPTATDVMLRKGKSDHITGGGNQFESLMAYNNPTGTQTLFGAAGTGFYDVTNAGAIGSEVVSGLTNSRWQSINYTNSDGDSYLCCFNGLDDPQYWDGTDWIAITGISTPAITGVDPTTIVSATTHKRRMWLVEKDSLKAWYLPVDAVGGAANALDLSGIAKRGGYIMDINSWTLDGGAGLDDYWVAVTSEGEVIVYAGTDPSSGDTWAIKGVWYIGEPIGRRCMVKFGGDILLILVNGVWPLSKALLSATIDPKAAITDNIVSAMNSAAALHKGNFGWQLVRLPAADMLLLNVPVAEGSRQQQYVMNIITGAWCKFTGWEGNCFEILNGELYMGGDGVVEKVWDGFDDNGVNIEGAAKTAFDYYGTKTLKSFKMARPIVATNGTPTIEIGVNLDYEDIDVSGTLTFVPSGKSLWGISLWGIDVWASGLQTLKNWIGLSGIGLCAATRVNVSSSGLEIRWQATDILFEPGDGAI